MFSRMKVALSLVLMTAVLGWTIPAWSGPVVTMQDAEQATGDGAVLNVSEYGSAGLAISGTFDGTITIEGSTNGTTWAAWPCMEIATTKVMTSSVTAAGQYVCQVSGLASLRARISTYNSGEISVTGIASKAAISGITGFKTDANGNILIALGTCLSGESACVALSPNTYIMVTGASVRSLQMVGTGGVPSTAADETTATMTLPIGTKTFHGVVTCTGTCTQTQAIYGNSLNNTTTGELLCTLTLNEANPAHISCLVTTNWNYYYVVTSGSGGTTPLAALFAQY